MDKSVQYSLRGVLMGIVASWPIGLAVFVYGLLFGMLSRQAHMTFSQAMAMSMFVFAGASQLIVLDLWRPELPVVSVILTCVAVNLRHILMGAALEPWFSGISKFKSYFTLFFMNDESWALTMERYSKGLRDAAFLLGSGLVIYVSWLAATILGHSVIATLRDPAAYGLDFAFTAVFLALLVGMRRGKRDVMPWMVAAFVSILVSRLLPGKWYIFIGAICGSGIDAILGGRRDGSRK